MKKEGFPSFFICLYPTHYGGMGTAKAKLRTTSTNGLKPVDVVRSLVLAFPSGPNRLIHPGYERRPLHGRLICTGEYRLTPSGKPTFSNPPFLSWYLRWVPISSLVCSVVLIKGLNTPRYRLFYLAKVRQT